MRRLEVIRLALLLLGTRYVRERWLMLAVIGTLWAFLGLAIFFDALSDVRAFPLHLFGYLFLVEGSVLLLSVARRLVPSSPLRLARIFVITAIGGLILAGTGVDDFILAMFFGAILLLSGLFRIASALPLRYVGWRVTFLSGVLEIVFAAFQFEPYPTHYHGTIPYVVGAALTISGLGIVRNALALRTLPKSTLFALLSARDHLEIDPNYDESANDLPDGRSVLTVHVWTPIGTAHEPVHRPLIDRYIAAIDGNRVISTGHASMEVEPDLYISLYPADDIDHSMNDFNRLLRATAENDVGGRFLTSYREESAAWCESTAKVEFSTFNIAALRAFWNRYRLDTTYNLTNRNCSSTVAHALETALEGTLGDGKFAWFTVLRTLFHWEFWVAGEIRVRAEAMAWTPGMVLDYARALEGILHPQRRAWLHATHWKLRREATVAQVRRTTPRE